MKPTEVLAVLYSPGSFFENHPPSGTLGGALKVVTLVAVLTCVAFAGMGVAFDATIDSTVTQTTLEPVPESVCETYENADAPLPEGCTIDEPRTEQVDVGSRVESAFFGRLPFLFVASFVGWLLTAAALHLLSALGDTEGSFGATLSVAGWASLPSLVGSAIGVGLLLLAVQGTEFASDPEVLADQVRALANRTGGTAALGSLVGVGWQAVVWTHGLRCGRDMSYGGAATVAAVVAVVTLALTL
jgi:hypothetical protein